MRERSILIIGAGIGGLATGCYAQANCYRTCILEMHSGPLSINRMVLALFAGRKLSQTLPGLDNFYMVGQWAGMPGVSLVATMGRDVVRQICRRDGRRFVSHRLVASGMSRPPLSAEGASDAAPQAIDVMR